MPAHKLHFIDLFAGIGGMRVAFEEEIGGQCVYTAEWNKYAQKTYAAFFAGSNHRSHRLVSDINDAFEGQVEPGGTKSNLTLKPFSEQDPTTVPDHDILLAGFPCQPFSLAGVSKKNSLGRAHGFADPTQGTLFFNIKEILEQRKPRAFLLENVKNLKSHDRKRTFKVICEALTAAGYAFTDGVLDAATVVPQHRERIFIVGFSARQYAIPPGQYPADAFWDAVHTELEHGRAEMSERFQIPPGAEWPRVGPVLQTTVDDKYTLTPKLWAYLQAYKAKHQAAGNGFGFGLVKPEDARTRTISARYHKDGSEALIFRGEEERPRRLTPLECLRLQGFPRSFERFFDGSDEQPVSDTQAYRQFGNAVCVPVVAALARRMEHLLQGGLPAIVSDFGLDAAPSHLEFVFPSPKKSAK